MEWPACPPLEGGGGVSVKYQLLNTLNHLICMYFEFENAWLPILML